MEEKKGRSRKFWSADEKIHIIRKHLSKAKIVEICSENKVAPTTFTDWLKIVLETGRDALSGTNKKEINQKEKLIEKYVKEIEKKNRIIAELRQSIYQKNHIITMITFFRI